MSLQDRYHKFSIQIDCAPFMPRPDTYLPEVLEGTGIEVGDMTLFNMFFGEWTWILKPNAEKDDLFLKAKPIFQARITALHQAGAIRYGTW